MEDSLPEGSEAIQPAGDVDICQAPCEGKVHIQAVGTVRSSRQLVGLGLEQGLREIPKGKGELQDSSDRG